jgi:hypothetical protein
MSLMRSGRGFTLKKTPQWLIESRVLTADYSCYLLAVSIGLTCVFLPLQILGTGFSNDTYTLLQDSVHMLTDGDLYTRWMEIDPPLILLLYAPVTALILFCGHNAAAPFLLYSYTGLLCLTSVLLTDYTLRLQGVFAATRRNWLAAGLITLCVMPPACGVFADREHMLFIFILPWAAQMLLGLKPFPFTALFAAVGFWIKPHNLILFAAFTLCCGPRISFRKRLLAPSVLIVISFGAAYLLLILHAFPGYFSRMAPLLLITYSFMQMPFILRLFNAIFYTVPIGCFLLFLPRHTRRAWYGFILAAFAACLLNGGWPYTYYLMIAPLSLLAVSELGTPSEPNVKEASVPLAALLLTGALIGASAQSLSEDIISTYETGYSSNFHALPSGLYADLREAADERFMLFSTALWNTNIASIIDKPQSLMGYNFLLPLPWLYSHPVDPRAPAIREDLYQSVLKGLQERPVIILDESPINRNMPLNVNLLDYFRQDARIREALKIYRRTQTFDRCNAALQLRCRFSIWQPQ